MPKTSINISKRLEDLEQDKHFRISQMPFHKRWKTPLYIAPVLLLSISLFCILYLFNTDRLMQWYTIIYVLIFVTGTIWFKAVKKLITKQFITKPQNVITVVATPILVDEFRVYALFSTGKQRHSPSFIKKQAENLSNTYADIIPHLTEKKTLPILQQDDTHEDPIHLCCIRKRLVTKKHPEWTKTNLFPAVLITESVIKPIKL